MLTISKYSVSFKSSKTREKTNTDLKALNEQREKERLEALERANKALLEKAAKEAEEQRKRDEALQANRVRVLNELKNEIVLSYPPVDNELSTKVARFLSQFTCSTQNASEHNLLEFFGDEETAKNLREKLSPECQQYSLELREEIQKLDEVKDPVMMLIAANNMKQFVPKEGVLNEDQQKDLLAGLKTTILTAIENADLTKFDEDERHSIKEMIKMIEVSSTVDFRISFKLRKLIDRLNKKKLKVGFIPPVEVLHRQLEQPVKVAMKF